MGRFRASVFIRKVLVSGQVSRGQDVNGIGIYGTLAGHAAPVTCVRFMQDRIVSADEKGGARIWRRHGETVKSVLAYR
jgi:hypothetical protein